MIFVMRKFFLVLLAAASLCGSASAQRLRVGARGGINTTDHRFAPVLIDGTCFTRGASRPGCEAGFVVRLNLTKRIHLQTELDYAFVNYSVRATRDAAETDVRLRSERLELPLQLGFQFGPVRLFGGASVRLNSACKSSHPDLLLVNFGSEDLSWMGGLGLNIKHFFIDVRFQGYPSTNHANTFISNGTARRVRMRSDLVWGGSLGFFF